MTKPTTWKIHLAFSYPEELLDKELITRLQKEELWMYKLELSHLPGEEEDMLAVLYVPACNPEAATKISLHGMHQALLRLDLPGITTYEIHVRPIRSILQA